MLLPIVLCYLISKHHAMHVHVGMEASRAYRPLQWDSDPPKCVTSGPPLHSQTWGLAPGRYKCMKTPF